MPRKPTTKKGKGDKFTTVMREFESGKLRSGSGERVTSRKQAQAIAASMSGQTRKKSGK